MDGLGLFISRHVKILLTPTKHTQRTRRPLGRGFPRVPSSNTAWQEHTALSVRSISKRCQGHGRTVGIMEQMVLMFGGLFYMVHTLTPLD